MTIGKIKPTATIVAQFAAGVEVEAIQHEGKLFMPVVGLGEFGTKEVVPTAPKTTSAPSATESAPAESKPATKSKAEAKTTYTEDEMMEMSSKELTKILKDTYGVNPDDYEGKNTNKKLRNLILEQQEGAGDDADDNDEEEAEDEKPVKGKKSKKADPEPEEEDEDGDDEGDEDDLVDQIADALEAFDAGDKNRKKTLKTIVSLGDDVDEDAVNTLLDKFEDDEDADIKDIAADLAAVVQGKKPAKKSAPKKGKKSKKEDDLVEPEDLKVGDRVSVWWDDDNQEWYDGEVKSIKKGKILIAYDDDTEEELDPEVHTKIKKLAD